MVVVGTEDGAGLGRGKIGLNELMTVVNEDPEPVAFFQPDTDQIIAETIYPRVQYPETERAFF